MMVACLALWLEVELVGGMWAMVGLVTMVQTPFGSKHPEQALWRFSTEFHPWLPEA